jgi:hypothetical protein
MAKHPVSAPPEKKEKTVWQVNVYSEYDKEHVLMTLEKSVRDVIKNWNCVDYAISSTQYELDSVNMLQTMRRCGYVPIGDANGKFKAVQGMYRFKFISQ